jgi:hypothetical protein
MLNTWQDIFRKTFHMTRHRRSLSSVAHDHPRLVFTSFMRDIGIALSLKFLLLGALCYTFFDDGAKRGAHLDDVAVARAIVGVPATLSEHRHDR